ncbi:MULTISPECIES: M6 family metalloprotease domain-containing protein [Catenuloplanes]|uniref:M6 family metalloprotease-like protein n=1 Tax=Catenuloplanes niger TaxID=587534 RepID=A0AAE3ZXU6_9ACTN|nr:M6 family metalloprotease domain-containing protein [Catenuloplanes niger]MDR7327871.1 M6 family metalloprotease-like protein [Catenuloplanes niger]
MRRSRTAGAIVAALALSLIVVPATAVRAAPADPFRIIDPPRWENPDHMTWDDYVPVPGADRPATGSVRNFRIALVTLDYPDQPFVVTQAPHSTVFGNPQPSAAGVARADVPAFYRDFLNTPGPLNHGHTLHEYWMEDSYGRYGVDLTAFGPYEMPHPAHQYGITNDMNPGACPAGETCNRNLRTDGLGAWRADVGAVADGYELVFILSAGQDESSTWQEFGQMRFAGPAAVTEDLGPPDPALPNSAATRYVPWTSWASAATIWPNAGGGSSTQAESSGQAVYAHELSHLLSIGDNYNNPYGTPLRRAYTGPWSMMSRGSFNGPGGPHTRWQIPPVNGGAMGSLHTIRDKLKIELIGEDQVLRLSGAELAASGPVVARVTARAVATPGLNGLHIALGTDRSPACSVAADVLCDGGGYDNYTVEVVDRMGADSFTPDHGVLISKTKDEDRAPFQWVVDAHPEDIGMVDFVRPDGTPQMITMGDYRQLSDALFHAGTRSGSAYEYVDEANRLHFYVLDIQRSAGRVLSYTVAVRSLDGPGASARGASLSPGRQTTPATCTFTLTNTGRYVPGGAHPEDATAYLGADVYRLSASVDGRGWRAELPNALAVARSGARTTVTVAIDPARGAARTAEVFLNATSESDPAVTATQRCRVRR